MNRKIADAIDKAECVAAMTGAGVSTLCGIPDFRGPTGLYKNPDAERIFDIDWFDRDPSVYYRGCSELIYGLGKYEPGPVHHALKRLEDEGRLSGIITQNIDMLHQKAGSSNVYEVHGSPIAHHCRRCGDCKTFGEISAMIAANGGEEGLVAGYVPRCACGGVIKPDVVLYGEPLPKYVCIGARREIANADTLIIAGTSLSVEPAASFTEDFRGKHLVIVNRTPTPADDRATLLIRGDAAEVFSELK